ncbi:hypothetical protein SNE40_012930 [Patella caerulea]|uniref:C-type lectin n=1 Tax=Patella caerulea TaxID=87958 RepID=A0AAN8JL73_PATCE
MWSNIITLIVIYLNTVKGQSKDEFAFGRTFYLNPVLLSWDEALRGCHELNATLATIYSLSTIGDLEFTGDWTFWTGLHQDTKDNWTWSNGNEKDWTNWNFGLETVDEPVRSCVATITKTRNWWMPLNCSEPLPSLCEVRKGDCEYIKYPKSSLVAHNRGLVDKVSVEECKKICDNSTNFICRSFEYNPSRKFCQLSNANHILYPGALLAHDEEWDYYHRSCNNGGLINIASVSPIGILLTTPVLPSSTLDTAISTTSFFMSSSSSLLSSSSDITPSSVVSTWQNKLTICTEIDLTSRPPNDTVPEEVKALQEMQTVFKDRQLTLKKTSVSDPRTSSTYIGSTAVIVAFSIIGLIVLADIFTFPTHFKNVQRRAYLESRRRSRKEKQKLREKLLEGQLNRPMVISSGPGSSVISPEAESVIASRNRLLNSITPSKTEEIVVENHTRNMEDSGFGGWDDIELQVPDDSSSGAISEDLPLDRGDNQQKVDFSGDMKVGDNWTIRKQKIMNKQHSVDFIYDGTKLVSTQL